MWKHRQYIIKDLVSRGAQIRAYDPKAVNEAKGYYLKIVRISRMQVQNGMF